MNILLSNAMFALSLEPNNEFLEKKIEQIEDLRSKIFQLSHQFWVKKRNSIHFLKFDDNIFLEKLVLRIIQL